MLSKEDLLELSSKLPSSNEKDEAKMLIKYLDRNILNETQLCDEYEYFMLQVAISIDAKTFGVMYADHIIEDPKYTDILKVFMSSSLGKLYRDGVAVQKNLIKAKSLFEWASQFDYPKAIESLADFFYYGWATSVDYDKAFSLMLKSNALSSSLVSCYRLGDMYAVGRGCVQDSSTAFAFYQRAYNSWMTNGEELKYKGDVALRMSTGYLQKRNYQKALDYLTQAIDGYSQQQSRGSKQVQSKLDYAQSLEKMIKEKIQATQ